MSYGQQPDGARGDEDPELAGRPDLARNRTQRDPMVPSASSSNAQPTLSGRRIHPLRSLSGHKFAALAVMLVFMTVGLPVAWIKGTPMYRSEGVIYVSPRFVKNLEQDPELDFQSNSQYREFVQQQVRTINRFDIVMDALSRLGPNKSLWQRADEPDRRAAERLQAALDIRPVPDTYQIVVGLEGPNPEGLDLVVNAVLESFLSTAKKEEIYASDRRLEDLREEREKLLGEIRDKMEQRTRIAQDLGVTTFTEALPNPYDQLLITNKESLGEARRRRIEAEALRDVLDPSPTVSPGAVAKALVHSQVAVDPSLSSYAANLNQRRSELLSKIAGLTAEHPGRIEAEEEIKAIDNAFARRSSELTQSYVSTLLEQRRADARQALLIEQSLDAEVAKQSAQAEWYAGKFHEALNLGLEIERERGRLDSIENRISFLELETQAPGFVRMFSMARQPDIPFQGGRRKLFLMFAAAAIFVGLLVPIAVDFIDPRIHSAGELEGVLGFPPFGWLPEKSGKTEEVYEDQLIRLASRLSRDCETRGTRVFSFTSVHPEDGTTTIVLDLARKLSELGIQTIVVEANALRSDGRYLAPDLNRPGLKDVLTGAACFEDAIVQATELLPNRMATGVVGTYLRDLRGMREMLSQLLSRYQVVLLDTPPILFSGDAEFLAGIVGGALLVVRSHKVERGDVKQACRLLEKANPGVAGVLLNRVRVPGEHYGLNRASVKRGYASKVFAPWLWR